MKNMVADVDIVCANYNNGPFLRDFFDSILASTVRPQSIIFVDDGSTDGSLDICEDYVERIPELQVVVLADNVGFANALNIGLSHARAKYILRIDPDDILNPRRIEL